MVASSYYFKLMVGEKKQQVNMYVLSFDHIKYHNVSARLCSKENGGSSRL